MKSVIDLDEMKGLMNEGTGTMQGTKGPRLVGPIDEGNGPIDASTPGASAGGPATPTGPTGDSPSSSSSSGSNAAGSGDTPPSEPGGADSSGTSAA